jgi:AAA+ superfamily predicted ATPase
MILVCPLFYYFYTELQRKAKEEEARIQKRIRTESKTKPSGGFRPVPRGKGSGSRSDTGKPLTLESLKDFWEPGSVIRKILASDKYKAITVRVLGFFILGVFGATWAPFYPWWMVIVISIIIAAIAYRFTYLALLVLIFFIIGSTGYQNPAFGWLFMIFALVISVISLFDWRFGYLVFLTLFMSRLGVAFFVPVASGLLLSMFMGLAVAVASGIFMTFMVTSADFTILSFFVGPSHEYGFITFSKPIISDFMPINYTDALFSIYNDVNLTSLSTIMYSNYTSMVPFIQIILWTVMVFVIVYLFQRYGKENLKNALILSLVPSAILIISGLGSILGLNHTLNIGTILVLVGIIGVMLSVVTFAFMNIELFKEFYLGKTREMPIGTRIGEMLTLRKTGFTEIGGLKEIKRELKDNMIGPLLRPEKAQEYGVEPPRGIMLFGPPGCGKTLLMRALATELNVEMVGVRCSDVMSKWYGESEGMIEKLFQEVKARRPCILFLDEIDAIAKRRDFYSADDVTPRLLSIMLSEMDGMDEASGVIVVGATNKPELVDPALMRPGRFDKIIFIPAPNYNSRKEIFKIHLKGKPYSPHLNLDNFARETEGYSGADIENLVKEAATLAMKRSISSRHRTVIKNDDFLKILPRIKPSLTHDMKKEYDKLQADFERKKYGREIKLPPTEEEAGARPTRRRKAAPKKLREPELKRHRVPPAGKARRKGHKLPHRKKKPGKWRNVVGLKSSKQFFKNTIENNLTGGK